MLLGSMAVSVLWSGSGSGSGSEEPASCSMQHGAGAGASASASAAPVPTSFKSSQVKSRQVRWRGRPSQRKGSLRAQTLTRDEGRGMRDGTKDESRRCWARLRGVVTIVGRPRAKRLPNTLVKTASLPVTGRLGELRTKSALPPINLKV